MQARLVLLSAMPSSRSACQKILSPLVSPMSSPKTIWLILGLETKLSIKEVREALSLLTRISGKTTYVLVIANINQTSAIIQNTLLKFLEESPPKVLPVLLATNTAGILDTVLSRTVTTAIKEPVATWSSTFTQILLSYKRGDNPMSLAKQLIKQTNDDYKKQQKTHPEITLSTQAQQNLKQTLNNCHQLLTQAKQPSELFYLARLSHLLERALQLSMANVSSKNVFFDLALGLL